MKISLLNQSRWLLVMALAGASATQATTIVYSVNALGADMWRYTYTLDNTAGAVAFDEFTVYFDLPNVSALVGFTSSAGWDSLIVQPDPNLPDAGFFDALHLPAQWHQAARWRVFRSISRMPPARRRAPSVLSWSRRPPRKPSFPASQAPCPSPAVMP